MSRQKKKITVEEVIQNLILLQGATHTSSFPPVSPYLASQESLVGRRICHKWKNSEREGRPYYGHIVSLVPGTTGWFNAKYDNEDVVLSLNLLVDIEKGDLTFLD